jgi:hypothetical protein
VMGFAALEINSDLEQARDHAIDNWRRIFTRD